jgi:hypothetical protein
MKFIKSIITLIIAINLVSCGSDKTDVKINQLFPVKIGDNWGFIDSTCKFNQDLVYQMADEYRLGRAIVQKNNKFSYVDQKGLPIHSFKFDKVTIFSNDSLAFILDEKNTISCINWDFKIKFTLLDVEEVHCYSNGIASIRKNNKYGFIDKQGNEILSCQFDAVGRFVDDCIPVANYVEFPDTSYLRWRFVDKSGVKINNYEYSDVHDFSQGLAAVCLDNKWGWIDKSGKFIFGNDFQECKSFSEGYAAFKKGDYWGLINKNGKIVAQPNYHNIGEMHEKRVTFAMGPKNVGYLDTSGVIVIQPQFESASNFKDGVAYVSKNNLVGILKKDGSFFCDTKFDSAPNYWGDFIYLQLNEHLEITIDSLQINP